MKKFFQTYFWNIRSETMTRKQYWITYLYMILFAIGIGVFCGLIANNEHDVNIAISIGCIPLMWAGVVIMIKRIRDTGVSGYWYLLVCIPYIGMIIGLIFSFIPTNYFSKKIVINNNETGLIA